MVHAITPLEENKSFLEKVQLGGKLCGLKQDNLWKKPSSRSASRSVTSIQASEADPPTAQPPGLSTPDSDSDSDDLCWQALPSSIKWPEKRFLQQRPKSRLMPSFTKKSLEFHNCPEAFPNLKPPPLSRSAQGEYYIFH